MQEEAPSAAAAWVYVLMLVQEVAIAVIAGSGSSRRCNVRCALVRHDGSINEAETGLCLTADEAVETRVCVLCSDVCCVVIV